MALSRRRKLAFSAILIVALYGVAELIAFVAVFVSLGGIGQVSSEIDSARRSDELGFPAEAKSEVLHPYLGFVMQPAEKPFRVLQADEADPRFDITDYGFYDDGPPIRKRADDVLIVGITGGSVAHQLSVLGFEEIAAELRRVPAFSDRKIEFVRLALRGHKQPQQLMTLAYVLSLGGEFDVVINLDGFNEVALPARENVPSGVFAGFPRSWQTRVVAGADLRLLRRIGHLTDLRMRRRELAECASGWSWSPLACLIWKSRDTALLDDIVDESRGLSSDRALTKKFVARGPGETYENDGAMYDRLTRIWSDSSRQMHRLCRANDIRYMHFLQPSLHIEGSKPFHAREKKLQENDWQAREPVLAGFPRLRAVGEELSRDGIAFIDLTGVFRETRNAIYIDDCHVNHQGNELLGRAIGRSIAGAVGSPDDE